MGFRYLAMTLALLVGSCDDVSDGGAPATTTTTETGSGAGGDAGSGGATGGDGGSAAGGGHGGAGGQSAPTEGTITITASPGAVHDGKRLIASVLSTDESQTLGGICQSISNGSAQAVVSEIPGADQCVLAAPVLFEPATYPVFAGIYPTGSAAPELCASTTVTVAGNVTAELSSFSSCQ